MSHESDRRRRGIQPPNAEPASGGAAGHAANGSQEVAGVATDVSQEPEVLQEGSRITIVYHTAYDALAAWSNLASRASPRRRLARPIRPSLVPTWARAALMFMLWLAILGTSLSVSGDSQDVDVELPLGLLGVWKTDAPKYEDRFFEISTGQLVFGTGGDTRAVHHISRVTRRAGPRAPVHAIWYGDAPQSEDQQFLIYFDRHRRQVRLRHQPDILWAYAGPPRDLTQLLREIEDAAARRGAQHDRTRDAQRSTRDGTGR